MRQEIDHGDEDGEGGSLVLAIAAAGIGRGVLVLAPVGTFDGAALAQGQGRQAVLLVDVALLAGVLLLLELALHQEGVALGQEVEQHQHERGVRRLDGVLVDEPARQHGRQ